MDELKELYAYLDAYTFVNALEVHCAVCDFFSNEWEKELSRWDTALCSSLADRYMSDRNMIEDENWDIEYMEVI